MADTVINPIRKIVLAILADGLGDSGRHDVTGSGRMRMVRN